MSQSKEKAPNVEPTNVALLNDTSRPDTSILWSTFLHTRTWLVTAWLAAAWWLGSYTITWWTKEAFAVGENPWAGKLHTFFLGALFLIMLAHALHRFYRMIGTPHLPMYPNIYQRKCKETNEDFPSFQNLKTAIKENFAEPKPRGENIFWAERGANGGWGQVFLSLGGLFVIGGLLLQPFMSKDMALRAPLFGAPWILIGLFLQWGEPHRMIAMWRQGNYIRLWAYSDRGWNLLDEELKHIEAAFAAQSNGSNMQESKDEESNDGKEPQADTKSTENTETKSDESAENKEAPEEDKTEVKDSDSSKEQDESTTESNEDSTDSSSEKKEA